MGDLTRFALMEDVRIFLRVYDVVLVTYVDGKQGVYNDSGELLLNRSFDEIIVMKDSALNLEPMKEYMRNEMNAGRRKSMINAFRTRFKDTLQKADQYASANKFKMYYPLYDNIEETIGYEGYQNLFVYILARYVKFCSENFNKYDNVYIAQIIQNLIMLKKGQLDEASRIMMSNAIKDILNILLLEE